MPVKCSFWCFKTISQLYVVLSLRKTKPEHLPDPFLDNCWGRVMLFSHLSVPVTQIIWPSNFHTKIKLKVTNPIAKTQVHNETKLYTPQTETCKSLSNGNLPLSFLLCKCILLDRLLAFNLYTAPSVQALHQAVYT